MDSLHPLKAYRDRQEPKLSQEDLAAKLGVSKASISRWESGARKLEGRALTDVSKATGIPLAELRPDLAEMFATEAAE